MTAFNLRKSAIGKTLAGMAGIAIAAWLFWPVTTPDEHLQQGLQAVARQDWPEVLSAAGGLKGHVEFSAEEHLFRGIFLLKSGQPVRALREFSQFEPVGANRELALLSMGEAFYHLNRLQDARRLFVTLAAEQPGHLDTHRWLASIAYDLGDVNRAMDELDIVIRLAPEDYRPHLMKGEMLFDLERFSDAANEYSKAVVLPLPEAAKEDALLALGRSHLELREYSAALDALIRAPRRAGNLSLQAECHLSLGDAAAARDLLAEAQRLEPEQVEMLRLLGRMELDAGRLEPAVVALRKVLKQEPHDHESRHQLAQALRLSGQITEADAEAARSVRIIELKKTLSQFTLDAIAHPESSEVRQRMAAICDELEMPELAAMWRKAAAACRGAAAELPAMNRQTLGARPDLPHP